MDYCRTGFTKKKQPEQGFGQCATAIITRLALDRKFLKHYALRRRGVISALAMIMMDNPLCPATGHMYL